MTYVKVALEVRRERILLLSLAPRRVWSFVSKGIRGGQSQRRVLFRSGGSKEENCVGRMEKVGGKDGGPDYMSGARASE